jgi:hypothetical protein
MIMRIIKTLAAIILILIITLGTTQVVFAASGAIWTTDSTGDTPDKNHYDTKDEVYLSGQKINQGNYTLDVIQTKGNTLVGSSNGATFQVDASGEFKSIRLSDYVYSVSSEFKIPGYDDSANNEYKVEIGYIDEKGEKQKIKSDNFKVNDSTVTAIDPTAAPEDETVATQAPESTIVPTALPSPAPDKIVTSTQAPENTVAPSQAPTVATTSVPTSTPAPASTFVPNQTHDSTPDETVNLISSVPAGGSNSNPFVAASTSVIPGSLPITGGVSPAIVVSFGFLVAIAGMVLFFNKKRKLLKR